MFPDTHESVQQYLGDLQHMRKKENLKDAESEKEKNPTWIGLHMSIAEKRVLSRFCTEDNQPTQPTAVIAHHFLHE